PGVSDLGREELEEAVQLVGVASQRRRQRGGVRVLRGLDGSHLHLQLAAELLDAAKNVNGVSLAEPLIEEAAVVPDPGLDPAARAGELEGGVCRARAGGAPVLLRDRKDAFDRPVLGELGDRGHGPESMKTVGTLAAMAAVQPFRAVRYSGAAGSLADLVAPP